MGRSKRYWKETQWIQESRKVPLYCISFNFFGKEHRDLFATTGSSRATVYRCQPNGTISQVLVIQDADDAEEYYVCRWSIDITTGAPLLLLAGKKAILQVFNCCTGHLVASFEGHGASINDIAVHPTQPQLVVTTSRDHCLRLWNLRSRTCVLIFEGDGGHRSEVLTADWQIPPLMRATEELSPPLSFVLVSGGMDNRIKIWNLSEYKDVLRASDEWIPESGGVSFKVKRVQLPRYNFQGVHWNYVDCVKWFGSAILSKSVDDTIVCWMPDDRCEESMRRRRRQEGDPPPGQEEWACREVATLQLEETRDVWWMRFSLDFRGTLLAQGTSKGMVLVYNLEKLPLQSHPVERLRPRRCKTPEEGSSKLLVRQTAVSFDGKIILSCHEDGSVTRFDLMEE